MSDTIIGIDLGTTNSAVAILDKGTPKLVRVDHKRILPSVVGISLEDELLVGETARNQWVPFPERTVRSIKRQMGEKVTVEMAGKSYSPQEISALILRRLKSAVETHLGETVTRAVITVPAYFTEVQRNATKEAGEIAGLTVERIINEPTAAALAHSLGRDDDDLRVLVYDLGGGTFDVSVIELSFGVVNVLATTGNNQLGGDDFDILLAEMLAEEFEDEHGIDLKAQHKEWARLLRAAEDAKIELSDHAYSLVSLEYIAEEEDGSPLHMRREVTRHEFEDRVSALLVSTIELTEAALKDAELEVDQIDHVLLVGGSTRIPQVQAMLATYMGQAPHTEIDPDASVALGAAVQAGIIVGADIDAILIDVTPMSLGIETATIGLMGVQGDIFSPLIQRNTNIPVQKSEVFSTMHPSQKAVEVKVYQGESRVASQNTLLGDFMFEGFKPNRPDGRTDITVNFRLDVNAILDVTVVDRSSGKKKSVQMKASRQRLSSGEVATSLAKVEEIHKTAAAPKVDAGTVALLDRAQAALDNPAVDDDLAEEIATVIDSIHQAAAEGNEERVEELGDELIDLLMEVDE